MSNLPEHIIIVVCKHSKGDEGILKILKEYFSGMPHIPYTDTSLYNSGTYYILSYTNTFRAILGNITAYNDLYNIFGFATYGVQTSSSASTFTKNIIKEFFNFRYLPLNITIDPKYLETLKLLTED